MAYVARQLLCHRHFPVAHINVVVETTCYTIVMRKLSQLFFSRNLLTNLV
ncbi:hypothetical protein Plhal304r1_c001g0002781 [Plasmopara halstedii]